MPVQKFETRRVEIEALRYTGTNFDELKEWTEGNFRPRPIEDRIHELAQHAVDDVSEVSSVQVYDKLHTTWINVLIGQWIVRGAKGEYYPCDDETFDWKYKEIFPPVKRGGFGGGGGGTIDYTNCPYAKDHSRVCIMMGDTCPTEGCGYILL